MTKAGDLAPRPVRALVNTRPIGSQLRDSAGLAPDFPYLVCADTFVVKFNGVCFISVEK
jgi:hypothetical protein